MSNGKFKHEVICEFDIRHLVQHSNPDNTRGWGFLLSNNPTPQKSEYTRACARTNLVLNFLKVGYFLNVAARMS